MLALNRGSTATSYGNGNASELYFSQRDGMRDLALYLGHHDNILHRKRLVIERKNFASLKNWELLRDRAFDTQFLSIFTGNLFKNSSTSILVHKNISLFSCSLLMSNYREKKLIFGIEYGLHHFSRSLGCICMNFTYIASSHH